MSGNRRVSRKPFKAKVALAGAKGERTTVIVASQFCILEPIGRVRCRHFDGRPGPSAGKRLHRISLEVGQVRGRFPEGLRT